VKGNKLSLSEEDQKIINRIPGFKDYVTEISSLIPEWEAARLRAVEYYKNNPDAPPLPWTE
jgi:hypothetical protein